MSAVITHVTSDDELATTIEGLECLQLQGLFHLNAGNLRRAWLSFRRGLNIAQLMCLDKDFMKARKGLDSSSIKVGKQMWHQVVMSDRYVSLLMGLPCGAGDECFGPEEKLNGVIEDVDLIFERRLSLIAGHVSNRNQAEPAQIFSQTQVIDEEMDRLAKEMPQSWWNVPRLDGKSRSRGVARQFNRLTTQMWYHQLVTLLHLPFMLRAATEYRYEYNRHTCLTASREILSLYIALRNANNTQLMCRVVDFAAFIAAVVIALASIHIAQLNEGIQFQQHNEDMALLQEIIISMESLAESSEREFVAKQSVAVLRALLKVNDPSKTFSGNLRLTVPYFGTISIARLVPIQNVSLINSVPTIQSIPSRNMIAAQQHDLAVSDQFINAEHLHGDPTVPSLQYIPVVSFISSQFRSLDPALSMDNWDWQEEDTLLFDSLLSSDIGGFDSF